MIARISIILAFAVSVAGCAFQLQDSVDLPRVMQTSYVNYSGTDQHMLRSVARALSLAGVRVSDTPENASAFLDILSAGAQRRVLLKDFAGRARETELIMWISYRLRSPDGGTLMDVETVRRRTTVVLEPADPLSSSGEVASAAESLREEAVWDMLRRIAASAETIESRAAELERQAAEAALENADGEM